MKLNDILIEAVNKGASDIHLKVGLPPVLRINKKLLPLGYLGRLTEEIVLDFLDRVVTTKSKRAELLQNGEAYNADPDFNPKPIVKLFNPVGSATWLITSVNPNNPDLAFGLCDLGMGCPELSSVSIEELSNYKGPLNLGIERDVHWQANKSLSEYATEARQHQQIVA